MEVTRSQKSTLSIIIIGWSVVIILLLFTTEYFSQSNIHKIERGSAVRMKEMVKNYINLSFKKAIAFSHTLIEDRNFKNSIDREQFNLPMNILRNNHLSGLYFFNKDGDNIYSASYDLKDDYFTHVSGSYKRWLSNLILKPMHNKGKYNILKFDGTDYAFFVKNKNNNFPSLFLATKIYNYQGYKGMLLIQKNLDPHFFKNVSTALDNTVKYIPLKPDQTIKNIDKHNTIANAVKLRGIYAKKKNKDTYSIYYPQRDINSKLIGIVEIDIPRGVYNASEKQNRFSQIVLLILSVLGIIAMSLLVRSFFRKQLIITLSFERFFPRNLLSILRKKTILDIHLGDVSEKKVSVLFLDIRKFTTISENMSPKENFDFINTFLKYLAPMISANNGFIDKYIGDAIMALFPDPTQHADNALTAAFDILDFLVELNEKKLLGIDQDVAIGVGINTGDLMIGILGTEARLSGTAIGDTVNTASRIESLTKQYSLPLLISQTCLESLTDTSKYHITEVDKVKIRGRTQLNSIYSVERL